MGGFGGFHPAWMLLMVISVIMVFVSFYEGKRLTQNITKKSTKFYVQFSIIAVWGVIALFALGKAGYG